MEEKVLFFEVLTQLEALEIAYTWKYEGELSFYDMTADPDELEEFLDEDIRGHNTFSVRTQREESIVAYFHYSLIDNATAEIILGISPMFLGKGYGKEIILYAEEALKERKGVKRISVAVAKFNGLASGFYEQLGYQCVGEFRNRVNGSIYDFLKMEKAL